MDSYFLGWHASIQPFPVVIPHTSPMTVVFLCTTHRGAKIVVVSFGELCSPRPFEPTATDGAFKTLLEIASTQPRPSPTARPTDEDHVDTIDECARDASQLCAGSALPAPDAGANRNATGRGGYVNRSNPPRCNRPPRRSRRCQTTARRRSTRTTAHRAGDISSSRCCL